MNGMLRSLLAVILIGSISACGGSSGGGTTKPRLYGTTHGNGTLGNSQFVELDPDTGAVLDVINADTGYYINSLAWYGGKFYATTGYYDPVARFELLSINPSTGAVTDIGPAGIWVQNLAIDSHGNAFCWDEDSDDPCTIDLATGAGTLLGEAGIGTATHALFFDETDTLYFANYNGALYTIDLATGLATDTGLNFGSYMHHGKLKPGTDELWGLNDTWDTNQVDNTINVGNITTGTIDNTVPTIQGLFTLAWRK